MAGTLQRGKGNALPVGKRPAPLVVTLRVTKAAPAVFPPPRIPPLPYSAVWGDTSHAPALVLY